MSDRAKIFANCGKIILRAYNTERCSDSDRQIVAEARKCLLVMIREIAEACEDGTAATISGHVKNVLSDLHPEIKYDREVEKEQTMLSEKLIRDLGEICVTFRSLELGYERDSRERMLEARLFCEHMRDEFLSIEQ